MLYKNRTLFGVSLLGGILFVVIVYPYMNGRLASKVADNFKPSDKIVHVSPEDRKPSEERKQNFEINLDNVRPLNTQANNGSEHKSTKYILIFAYMHTGSSYMGNLMSKHAGSFYQFEPLRDFRRILNSNNKRINFLNGTSISITEEDYHAISSHLLLSMFRCNLKNIDVSSLYGSMGKRDQLEEFVRCTYTLPGHHRPKFGVNSKLMDLIALERHVRPCIEKITSKCLNSTIRTTKVIRLSTEAAELILKAEPNIRIIHLFRDPRAMLDSSVRRNEMNLRSIEVFRKRTVHMCSTMLRDFKIMEALKNKYPGNILTLRYEDMASLPVETAKYAHTFVDLPFTESVETFVSTRSVESDKNSTYKSLRWRTHIQEPYLQIVEDNCKDLFPYLGYLQLKNLEQVRNYSNADHLSYQHWQKSITMQNGIDIDLSAYI